MQVELSMHTHHDICTGSVLIKKIMWSCLCIIFLHIIITSTNNDQIIFSKILSFKIYDRSNCIYVSIEFWGFKDEE
jgi:hypothetical protein